MSERNEWARPPVETPEPESSRASWERELWSDERPVTEAPLAEQPEEEKDEGFHHPLDRVTGRLPRRTRLVVDWVVTIVGAVAIVLAIKAYVVNPYRIPSSSMEPTLHCARPATGCEARFSDRVLANRFIYRLVDPARGDIVVFETTPAVIRNCSAGGTFVKRIVGLPGETLQLRSIGGRDFVYIDGRKLDEPYVQPGRRSFSDPGRNVRTFKIPDGSYFMMGDNRDSSCDSRSWGSLPGDKILGKVFMTYWPPQRISFR